MARPQWTPDGKIVFMEESYVYVSHTTVGGQWGEIKDRKVIIYEMDKDGSNLYQITPAILNPQGPVSLAASDTLLVACFLSDQNHNRRMLLIHRKTGQILKTLGQGAYADFSPDGKRIVYQKYEGDNPKGIWIMDLESGRRGVWTLMNTPLTPGGAEGEG